MLKTFAGLLYCYTPGNIKAELNRSVPASRECKLSLAVV